MSLGNVCQGGTSFLTEKYVGPTLSLGNVSLVNTSTRTKKLKALLKQEEGVKRITWMMKLMMMMTHKQKVLWSTQKKQQRQASSSTHIKDSNQSSSGSSEDEDDDDDDELQELASTKNNEAMNEEEMMLGSDHNVDKKADEFIAKFREPIRLQRIASIRTTTTTQAKTKTGPTTR
ncbi:putative homeobox-leucine zipper protein HAT4-like protein [Tanacetum coccineum]